jgi:hypothetical protein
LAGREWDWDDEVLFTHAVERFGEARGNVLLEESKDLAVRTYWERSQQQNRAEAREEPRISHRERMRAITVEEILSAAEEGRSRFGLLRGWGMHADDAELATVLRHLSAVTGAGTIAGLLAVFSNRSAPQAVARLIELSQHVDPEVRRRALVALEQNEHPLVRDLALSRLGEMTPGKSVVGLFIRNFRPGDERRILEAIDVPDDEVERHGLLMDVIGVLENNPDADSSQLGIVAYASTPCENCRADSLRLLHRQGAAPGWLLEECRHDSSERTRDLVAEITGAGRP